jgi:hypothetical protein
MPTSTGQFAQLLQGGLYEIIFEDLAEHGEEFPQFMNVTNSTKNYEEDQLIAGLGIVPTKPEGEPLKLDQPIQGGTLRITHTSYGLGWQVTREMWDDDQYGIMVRVARDFAAGIRQTIELNAIGNFTNAFSTASTPTTTIDGVSLCNTAHPLLGGGTYSNQVSTNVAFSTTGLQEATILFEKMVNERGLLKRMMPAKILLPVDLQFKCGEILHSHYKPYTGNNEINVMQGRFEPIFNHYFTSTVNWFLLAMTRETWTRFYWRIMPQFDQQDDFFTKGASYSCYFRQSSGVYYWHGIVGSPGQ